MTPGTIFDGCLYPELNSCEFYESTTAPGTPSSSASVTRPTPNYDQYLGGVVESASDTPSPILNQNDPISHGPTPRCKCCECGAPVERGRCIECGHRMCPDCRRSFRTKPPITKPTCLPTFPTSTPFPLVATSPYPITHSPLTLYDCCKCGHLMRSSEAGIGCRKCGHSRCRACTKVDYEQIDDVYDAPCVPCRCCRCGWGWVVRGRGCSDCGHRGCPGCWNAGG